MSEHLRTRTPWVAFAAGALAACACAGGQGAAPAVRIAPAPIAASDPAMALAPRPSIEEAFAAAVARGNERCALSVRESEAMDPEASSSRIFCFDRDRHPVMLERTWGSDAGGGSHTVVIQGNRLYAAREVDSPTSGPETGRAFCSDVGGEAQDEDGARRPLSAAEIGALVANALLELARLELPEADSDGDCSEHPEFDTVCFSPDFCYTPSQSVEVSPELCGRAEELQTRLAAIERPD